MSHQGRLSPDEDKRADGHGHTGAGKTPSPTVGIGQHATGQWPQSATQIDTHVEQGEGRIAPLVMSGIESAYQH